MEVQEGVTSGLEARVAFLEKEAVRLVADQGSISAMLEQLAKAVASLAGAVTMLNDAFVGKAGPKS